MVIWHLTPDAPRFPFFVSAGQHVNLQVGTWPIEAGQRIWIDYRVVHPDETEDAGHVEGTWNVNRNANSYWYLNVGPFADGDRVEYQLRGQSRAGPSDGGTFNVQVGPKLHLAILWHQHQPLYKDLHAERARGDYRFPWVRLHAIRDYYAMAAMLESYPDVHLTINLTPVLLWQIEDYAGRDATDQALDLTLTAAARLSAAQCEELLSTFFEADWHRQIYLWPRYSELFEERRDGKPFTTQDLSDLQMWFNLAWFAPEFQEGPVSLPDGQTASVADLIQQGRGFTVTQIEQMVGEQLGRRSLRHLASLRSKSGGSLPR